MIGIVQPGKQLLQALPSCLLYDSDTFAVIVGLSHDLMLLDSLVLFVAIS